MELVYVYVLKRRMGCACVIVRICALFAQKVLKAFFLAHVSSFPIDGFGNIKAYILLVHT